MDAPHTLTIEPHEALKRDFGLLITELNAAGFSNVRIAYKCGVGETTVRRWAKRECQPDYHYAIVIIGMHYCYCGPGRGKESVRLGISEQSTS